MPTQCIAETERTLSLQSQEHVASNIHSGLDHFQWTRHCGIGASLGGLGNTGRIYSNI